MQQEGHHRHPPSGDNSRHDGALGRVAEQLQARTNIGAVAASDVGNTDTDFVVIFDGALA